MCIVCPEKHVVSIYMGSIMVLHLSINLEQMCRLCLNLRVTSYWLVLTELCVQIYFIYVLMFGCFLFFSFQTTLAHIISSASRKKGTARFVTLSATSASINDVREVIKQAQNELRLCKRKTILFIDEIHRFNKSQQVE